MAGLPMTATLSKSQRAYRSIKAKIDDGSYSPGYRLVLNRLAAELQVSTVPVREAIRMLEAEGLVHFERNIGAQVAMIDPTQYQVTMETLSLVEGFATAISAPFITAADLDAAREVNAELEDCLHRFDPANFTRLNLRFHSVLFERCPNPHVLELVHRGWARLRSLRESTFSFVPGRARESVNEHAALLGLIERRAPALEIELAARNHRLATLGAFLEHQAASHDSLREPSPPHGRPMLAHPPLPAAGAQGEATPFPEEGAKRPSRRATKEAP